MIRVRVAGLRLTFQDCLLVEGCRLNREGRKYSEVEVFGSGSVLGADAEEVEEAARTETVTGSAAEEEEEGVVDKGR